MVKKIFVIVLCCLIFILYSAVVHARTQCLPRGGAPHVLCLS
jgi:hypothetical protein